ncbi:hypothetical protein BXZ70DRAFT_415856 [Cristinia sonorae]|uniref:DNA replication factor Cdt1 C-terminal domain-containing protein n=1 Tax=Cristinia sonorae TaxID=1940300 RepID=A0A8K0XTX5_9AGAR|nr:hypothetical protein BXZ70DRAFT_415856 [Cristinia sonorae]
MSDIYTSLHATPRRKRTLPEDDDNVLTPKRLRTAPPTPPATITRRSAKSKPAATPLPPHLSRLHSVQTALQHALSHALATCAISPSSDTGIVRSVLNHISLSTYSGLTTKFDIDDLRRLCWLWEWDGKTLPSSAESRTKRDVKDDEDNPFLEDKPVPAAPPKDWTRGSMGFVLSQTTHFSKVTGTRIPAYGIGIEVEMDIDKDMGEGMAAVARWTTASETRRQEIRSKLDSWVQLHPGTAPVPNIPMALLPPLPTPAKPSKLTRLLASSSPKSPSAASILARPTSPTPSFSRSPTKSPTKRPMSQREFAIPFPVTPSSRIGTPSKNTVLFPQTPSSRHSLTEESLMTPTSLRTPTSSFATPSSSSSTSSLPSTPVHQRGPDAATAPATPSTSRRQALYDRIRQRSLQSTPTKIAPGSLGKTSGMTKEQLMKLSQEETRRRCLLGRLGGIAESVWMLFSNPASSSAALLATRKRRSLPAHDVATAILKSSPVPISLAEAEESLNLLAKLCPFFLRKIVIAGEDWLEMPSATTLADNVEGSAGPSTAPSSPTKSKAPAHSLKAPGSPLKVPGSPGKGRKTESIEELVTRSPRRVKKEGGGLREVREIIRRELEMQD